MAEEDQGNKDEHDDGDGNGDDKDDDRIQVIIEVPCGDTKQVRLL